ncbi:MAG TPA: hypothetical protein VM911_22985 [Pyrinomonadaceae bacterium]|nr:hypothetical protein [Pyrinomonadaceae bacterium]
MSEDTESLDAIIRAMYESVSGPAGLDRDTLRERSLFMPGAHLVRVTLTDDGTPQAKMMDVDAYLKDTAEFFRENDFYEIEIARRTEVFGQIAQVFSTYEARHALDDPAPFKRGINSIQLFNDGNRWWIVGMLWDNEREGNPMPAEYLP